MLLSHFAAGRQISYRGGLISYTFSTGTKACVTAADLIDSDENLHCFTLPLSSCYIKANLFYLLCYGLFAFLVQLHTVQNCSPHYLQLYLEVLFAMTERPPLFALLSTISSLTGSEKMLASSL